MNSNTTKSGVIAALIVASLAACTPAPAPVEPAQPVRTVAAQPIERPVIPITVAPAGDSITAWGAGVTWPAYLDAGDDIQIVPGFAAGGLRIAAIAASTPNCACDVVVVMAGTNDMSTPSWATPMGERAESLVQIVTQSGAAHALILAVPPINIGGPWVTEWNAEQQRLAAFYGWSFFDPWADIRTPENGFVAGSNFDNAHPTPEAQAHAADLIRPVILALTAN